MKGFKSVRQRLMSALFITFLFTSSFFFFLIALSIWLFTSWIDGKLKLLHRFTRFWSSMYIRIVPSWLVEIEGTENIDQQKTYVVISNHQSFLDIMLASFLNLHFKWVSKAEIFKVPFVGWNMKLNRYIKLERGGKQSIARMMRQCEKTLNAGNSVFIFPEGTRSEDGTIKLFKTGAFSLAKKCNVDILPIVIDGTRNAVPKNSLLLNKKCRLKIKVLPSISFHDFAEMEINKLTQLTQNRIVRELELVRR